MGRVTASIRSLENLEIVGPNVTLRATTDAHFHGLFAAMHQGVHSAGTVSASFPPTALVGVELESLARRFWLRNRAEWSIDRWWLDLTVFANSDDACPIGMQVLSASDFPRDHEVSTASWLTRERQGAGFGREMRRLVLDFAFAELDAQSAISEAFPENVASERVSIACGYKPDGIEEIEHADGLIRLHRYRLVRRTWEHASRVCVTVRGFDRCRERFGI